MTFDIKTIPDRLLLELIEQLKGIDEDVLLPLTIELGRRLERTDLKVQDVEVAAQVLVKRMTLQKEKDDLNALEDMLSIARSD